MKQRSTDILLQNNVFLWIAFLTGLVLLIPLIAMQFSDKVVWTPADFVAMGTLLFGAGSLFVLTARRVTKYQAVVAIVFAAALLYVWAELAVGVFTDLGS